MGVGESLSDFALTIVLAFGVVVFSFNKRVKKTKIVINRFGVPDRLKPGIKFPASLLTLLTSSSYY